MMKKGVFIVLMLCFLFLLISAVTDPDVVDADPATIVVPDDLATIQEAIDSANEGDTIFVKTGTYCEHVVVNKALSLVGENSSTTIIDGNWTGVVIKVTQNSVNISGLTVRRSGSIYWENAGIILSNVQNCSIGGNILTENSFAGLELNYSRGCSISGNSILSNGGVGITLVGGSFNDLSRNTFAENGWSALTLNDNADNNTISENNMTLNNLAVTGHCINLYRSNNNSIQKNKISGDDNGIRLEYWSNFNAISRNDLTNNTQSGVSVETYSDDNTISDNMINGSRFGVIINGSRYTEICNNTIAHNYGSDWDAGVRLESAGYTVVRDNEIFDNWRGILLYASSPYVSISGNDVIGNEYGIRVAKGGSSYVNVSGNYVANNRGYGIDVTGFGGGGVSNYATIARNLIVNNTFEAVGLGEGSNYNTVVQNNMSENGHAGLTLERYSNYNTIVQNNMIENAYGICFDLYIVNSTQNMILNNNIINNTQQVRIAPGSVNAWNGGYSSGGNYWSDYSGTDVYRNLHQNETGSDGIGDTPYVIDVNNQDNYPLMKPYPWASHDIGITALAVSKTAVGQGSNVSISGMLFNYCNETENLHVTVYANTTILATFAGITVTAGNFTTFIFVWNTSGFANGDYTIRAYVDPVQNEAHVEDNDFTYSYVVVTMAGDVTSVTGLPDGEVDMHDISLVCSCFGGRPGDPRWENVTCRNCDINEDGEVNMRDIGIACNNFGKH